MNADPLKNFIGQEAIKKQLEPEIMVAKKCGRQLPHMIFHGPPGLGKDHMVHAIVKSLNAEDRYTEIFGTEAAKGRVNWSHIFAHIEPDLQNLHQHGLNKDGYVIGPNPHRILCINEAEIMPRSEWEKLHSALQPCEDGRLITPIIMPRTGEAALMWVAPFTLIVCTNYIDELLKNGRAAMHRCPLQFSFSLYTFEELANIVIRYSNSQKIPITKEAATNLAKRAKGNVRRLLQLWGSVDTERILSDNNREITKEHVENKMNSMAIAEDGLDETDILYLSTLAQHGKYSPVGEARLASILGLPRQHLKDNIEPWLFKQEYITIHGGRLITTKGLHRLQATQAHHMQLVTERN